jgi:osmotically-inducible protein OsmY
VAIFKSLAIFGAGYAAAWFLDPDSGARRRNVTRDKAFCYARMGLVEAVRKADYASGVAKGAAHAVTPSGDGDEAERLNDPALARKVESEIFRDADAPKGSVNVNAEDGVIYLRGQVEEAETIERLVAAAQRVDGVREVKSLLHTPGTPAPNLSG